jgi:hypothetical protein
MTLCQQGAGKDSSVAVVSVFFLVLLLWVEGCKNHVDGYCREIKALLCADCKPESVLRPSDNNPSLEHLAWNTAGSFITGPAC